MALSYSSMENIKVVLIWGWWWLFSHDGFPQQIFFDEFYNDLYRDTGLVRRGRSQSIFQKTKSASTSSMYINQN